MDRFAALTGRRVSRRGLLKGVGATAVGLGLAQTGLSTAGLSSNGLKQLARGGSWSPAPAAAAAENLQDILDITTTTEAFGVTILGAGIASNEAGNFDPPIPDDVIAILKAARAQEMFHLQFFQSLGGNMLVDTFHVPDPAILTDPVVFFQTIDQQETREVAAQIAAMQTFTELGRPDLVKVSFQYAAEEGEHRLLGSYASGNRPPNNRGFAPKPYETVGEFYAELQALGIIGGDGPAATYPGPGEIDTSNVIETTPGGPMVVCMPPAEGNATGVVVLVAQLTGVAESGTYDADAFGFAKVAINADTGQICFRISVANIAPATASHIHEGGAGVAGPVVVPFTAPDADGFANGCVDADPALAQAIIANPSGYYVNVHNADYPGGVVRGQLMPL